MPDDQAADQHERTRGREASRPQEIPAQGWRDVLWRSWRELSDNNIFLIAGGVTYSALLALFPALAALVSIYGLLLDPNQIEQQVGTMAAVLPDQSRQLLLGELHQLASASGRALGFSAIVALLFALWSASRGMSGMITALDVAYEEKERRGFLRVNLLAVALTLGGIFGGIVAIALIAVLPAAVQFIGLSVTAQWALLLLEWPLLIALVMLGLAVMYRYGPDREYPQWRWISPGAVTATVLWILASVAFTAYVANFNNYDKTYGSLGGAVIMLTWLYISALVVLLGAVVNNQAEQQTRHDSTVGAPEPMGRRGARAADTLGPSSG